MHVFAGDSSVGAMPTEVSNAGTVLVNTNASEFCLICCISHSPTHCRTAKYCSVSGASLSIVAKTLWYIFQYVALLWKHSYLAMCFPDVLAVTSCKRSWTSAVH